MNKEKKNAICKYMKNDSVAQLFGRVNFILPQKSYKEIQVDWNRGLA
jgi:hypothetical protein